VAGTEARSTAGQAELGKTKDVPKYNLGTRRKKKPHRLGSLCHQGKISSPCEGGGLGWGWRGFDRRPPHPNPLPRGERE